MPPDGITFHPGTSVSPTGLTVWMTDQAIAVWRAEPPTTLGGQPRHSQLAIATALPCGQSSDFGYNRPKG
jgi:hypothetical protein